MAPVSVSADPFLPTASFVREEDEHPKDRFSNEVPVVSLDGIDGAQRAEIRDRVAAACEDWGIFQVVDHGVDAALVAHMARLARDFFALPPEDKLRFDMSGGGGKKGGFIVSRHLQAGEVAQDWRELVIFFSYPVKSRDYSRWPDKPAAWRAVVGRYSEQLTGLACKLLGMLSEAMGVETDALAKACVDMDQKVVINFCPQCPRPDLKLGIKRHTDPGTMELLLQDLGGGLQATRDGGQTWTTVQPVEGAFLVSLGDHAHLLSNGRFKNAEHQAVVKLNSDRSRLSIATLQRPAPDAMVYPLAVRDGEAPILDKPITFAEMYRRNKVRNMELAKLKKQAKPEKKSAMAFAAPALNAPNGKPLDDILA